MFIERLMRGWKHCTVTLTVVQQPRKYYHGLLNHKYFRPPKITRYTVGHTTCVKHPHLKWPVSPYLCLEA